MRHLSRATVLFVLLAACSTATVEQKADDLMSRARANEPEVTPRLEELATRAGGRMYKLEYRFKSRKSMLRKIRKIQHEHPELGLDGVEINDALRYTMIVEDEPAGRYVRSVQSTLADLESRGHRVDQVKNYWPKGDNYSGVNCVLVAPDGLPWELQFHTAGSVEINGLNRDMYEELREVGTPLERKRELFDAMAARWAPSKVPTDVLTETNLHAREIIKQRKRP